MLPKIHPINLKINLENLRWKNSVKILVHLPLRNQGICNLLKQKTPKLPVSLETNFGLSSSPPDSQIPGRAGDWLGTHGFRHVKSFQMPDQPQTKPEQRDSLMKAAACSAWRVTLGPWADVSCRTPHKWDSGLTRAWLCTYRCKKPKMMQEKVSPETFLYTPEVTHQYATLFPWSQEGFEELFDGNRESMPEEGSLSHPNLVLRKDFGMSAVARSALQKYLDSQSWIHAWPVLNSAIKARCPDAGLETFLKHLGYKSVLESDLVEENRMTLPNHQVLIFQVSPPVIFIYLLVNKTMLPLRTESSPQFSFACSQPKEMFQPQWQRF